MVTIVTDSYCLGKHLCDLLAQDLVDGKSMLQRFALGSV